MPMPTGFIPGLTRLLPLVGICILLISCGREKMDHAELMRALEDPTRGLVRERSVGDLVLRCKYIPPELSAWREMRGREFNIAEYHRRVAEHARLQTFALQIAPREDKGAAVSMRGVQGYEEFAQRTAELNFGMEDRLRLVSETCDMHPVLASLNNSYELNRARTVMMVFAPREGMEELPQRGTVEVVFEDDLFATGIHRFVFDAETLVNAPQLAIGSSQK